ncbi:MAG: PqqD family peptide modification chaperone [Prevotella sp.]|nr:PqqD family peptide modification chaperone [Prevotella sp.]
MEQKDNFDAETLTELLLDNYDVDKETALNDASELIKQWLEAEIIE